MSETLLEQNRKKLLQKLKPIYINTMGEKEKVPEQLTKISKDLLIKYPKNIFIKVIEIKTFKEKPDKELNDCFPGDYYSDENDAFKAQIYEFLYQNVNAFSNNSIVIKGIKNIIDNMKQDSILKKYTSLIDIIANNFDEENKLLCEVLVTNPLKYKELLYLVDSNLNISPLPKNAQGFYAMKNYTENKIKFEDYTTKKEKNDIDNNFRKEIMDKFKEYDDQIKLIKSECDNKIKQNNNERDNKIKLIKSECDNKIKQNNNERDNKIKLIKNDYDNKIKLLNEEIIILKEESKTTKEALFNIQIRDVIKAFIRTLLWTLHINKSKGDHVKEVGDLLIEITGQKNKGIEEVLLMLKNLKNLKDSGNDDGHHIKNIGFDDSLLPPEIKIKYDKIKKNANCGIAKCDCVALLLCLKDINDSSEELTKKKYELFKELVELSVKDWENNKNNVKDLLNSYEI